MNRRSRTTKPFYQDRFLDIHDLHEIQTIAEIKTIFAEPWLLISMS